MSAHPTQPSLSTHEATLDPWGWTPLTHSVHCAGHMNMTQHDPVISSVDMT